MSIHTLQVSEDFHHVRLDVFLTEHLERAPSRVFVQKLIGSGQVKVNGKAQKSNYKVSGGDEITVAFDLQPVRDDIKPEKIALDIFYEDHWLLIVNKPVGMLVHPVRGQHSGTLVNALLYHCQNLSDLNLPHEQDDLLDPALIRPGIVHRLDRETSGLLVVAKDNHTHVQIARQFEAHEVQKQYVALVRGRVEFQEGKIDAPLGRHPRQRDKKAIVYDATAKDAVTRYRVIERISKDVTLLSLFPQSGRTHQLRVHMAHIGHPILGDAKYGDSRSFGRLALHARALGFTHPGLKCFMTFMTPVPEEFLTVSDK